MPEAKTVIQAECHDCPFRSCAETIHTVPSSLLAAQDHIAATNHTVELRGLIAPLATTTSNEAIATPVAATAAQA